MTHPLIDFFEQYLPFNKEEKDLIVSRSSFRELKRKELIIVPEQPCKHYNFVIRGCLKMYYTDAKGNQHIIQFAAEKDWISDIGSFHSGEVSELSIKSMEPSEIIQIEKQDLYHLYLNIPKLDRIFKVIIENKFVELQRRVLQNISSTAQDRYLTFMSQYPNLIQRLPGTQVASYLGITPEFLSKIRKDLSKE